MRLRQNFSLKTLRKLSGVLLTSFILAGCLPDDPPFIEKAAYPNINTAPFYKGEVAETVFHKSPKASGCLSQEVAETEIKILSQKGKALWSEYFTY